MFCEKCGQKLNNEAKFCAHCGEECGEPNQQVSSESSTGKIFMEQLGTLTKVGVQGLKEATTQAQSKAEELSSSLDKSQSLKQLGEKKNLFLFTCVALAVNVLLLLSKTVYFELRYFGAGEFSVIGFCSEMTIFIKEYGRYVDGANDGPFYAAIKYMEIIGILFNVGAIAKTYLELAKSTGENPVSFKLMRISAIYSVAITFLFMFLGTVSFSAQRGVEFHLTLLGWVYVLESIVLIISVLKLSPWVKKSYSSLE